MTKPPESSPEMISDLILDLSRRGHGSYVLLAATHLENALENLICKRMPKLSKTMRDKLFHGISAFSHFSTKIDVAHAMDLISADTRHDLHVFRSIRNEFAHPEKEIHLHLDELADMMRRFRGFDSEMDRFAFFGKKFNELWSAINGRMESGLLAEALREYAKKHRSSPKKSS